MKRIELVKMGIQSMWRNLKHTILNLIISVLIIGLFLIISGFYFSMQGEGEQFKNEDESIEHVIVKVDKSYYSDVEKVLGKLFDEGIRETQIESYEVTQDDGDIMDMDLHIHSFREYLKLSYQIQEVEGLSVIYDEKNYRKAKILSVVERITTIMMLVSVGVVFVLLIVNQFNQIQENVYAYAQMKAFGYEKNHLAIVIGAKAITYNGISYLVAIILAFIVLSIDYNQIIPIQEVLNVEQLQGVTVVIDLIIVLLLSILALILSLSKIEKIEPMLLLKENES